MTKSLATIVFVASAFASAGCGDNPSGPRRVERLQVWITGGGNVLTVGDAAQISVRGVLTDDTEIELTAFSDLISLDPSVVTVTPAGVVTAVGIGTTDIRATYESKRGELRFRVR